MTLDDLKAETQQAAYTLSQLSKQITLMQALGEDTLNARSALEKLEAAIAGYVVAGYYLGKADKSQEMINELLTSKEHHEEASDSDCPHCRMPPDPQWES